jgi:hypothetical protein
MQWIVIAFDRHSGEGPEVILNSEAGLPVAVLRKAGKALRVAYRYFTGSPAGMTRRQRREQSPRASSSLVT